MDNETSHILNDIKLIIDFKLLNEKSTTNLDKIKLYDIMSLISVSIDKKISISYLKSKLNIGQDSLMNHINWLITNKIIHRSKLQFDMKKNQTTDTGFTKYDTYEYSIHKDISISSLERFIYTTMTKSIINYEPCIIKDVISQVLYSDFNNVSIDLYAALEKVFNNNKSLKSKDKASSIIYNIALEKYTISRSETTGRVFSTFTSMPNYLHEFIYINGQPVSEIDAKQSQLTLISNLTTNVKSNFHSIINNKDMYDYIKEQIQSLLKENELNDIKISKKVAPGYWSYFDDKSKKYKSVHWSKIERNEHIKPQTYAAIFSGFSNKSLISNILTKMFPEIINKFYEVIGINETNINNIGSIASRYLQSLESKIWIKAAYRLNRLGISVITKHDSILFNINDLKEVESVLKNEFKYNNIKRYKLCIKRRELLDVPFKRIKLNINEMEHLNKNTFSLQHIETNEVIKGTVTELCKITGYNKKFITELKYNRIEQYKQYKLIK